MLSLLAKAGATHFAIVQANSFLTLSGFLFIILSKAPWCVPHNPSLQATCLAEDLICERVHFQAKEKAQLLPHLMRKNGPGTESG